MDAKVVKSNKIYCLLYLLKICDSSIQGQIKSTFVLDSKKYLESKL